MTGRRAVLMITGLLIAGAGVVFLILGLDQADKAASVTGAVVGIAGLGFSIWTYMKNAPLAKNTSKWDRIRVTDSTGVQFGNYNTQETISELMRRRRISAQRGQIIRGSVMTVPSPSPGPGLVRCKIEVRDDMMEPGFSQPGPIRRPFNRLFAGDESEVSAPGEREVPRGNAKPGGSTESEPMKYGESSEVAHPRSWESEYPTYGISVRNVRGLQIGTGNLQVNRYEYQVDQPIIDFATVLSRVAVRDALKALSNDPENSNLQRKADKLLASGPLFRKQAELRVARSEMSSEQRSNVIDAFIFVEKSEGVHVGDRATQRNQFVYVVVPTVNAAQLLADDPTVRSAVIDCLCSPDEAVAGDVLRDELAAVLESTVLSSPDIRATGELIQLSAHGGVDVDGGDGVAIVIEKGWQQNEVCAEVAAPETVVKSVQEKRIGQSRDLPTEVQARPSYGYSIEAEERDRLGDHDQPDDLDR